MATTKRTTTKKSPVAPRRGRAPAPMPILAFSARVPLAPGLDSAVYEATVLIDRHDGAPLSDEEVTRLEAAYPPPSRAAAPAAPQRPRGTKRASARR
jgi:hypothetical protein